MGFEIITAVASGSGVMILAWMASSVHSLKIDVAVIKATLEVNSQKSKGRSNAKLRIASQ